MPPRKRAIIDEEANLPPIRVAAPPIPPPEPAAATLTPTEERQQQELDELVEQLGSSGRLVVYHIIDGRSTYAGPMDMEGFTLEGLFDLYGGGEKSVVVFQGKRRVDTVRVSLDPSIPPTSPRQRAMEAKRGAATGNGGGPGMGDLSTMLVTMATLNQQSSKTMMDAVGAMMTAMTQAATVRPPERDPMEATVTMMKLIREMQPQAATDPFILLEKGMNLGRAIAGANEGDPTTDIIKEGLGVVGKIVEASRGAQANGRGGNGDTSPPQFMGNPVRVVDPGPSASGGVAGQSPVREAQPESQPVNADAFRPWMQVAHANRQTLAMAARFMSGDTAAVEILRRMDDDTLNDLLADMDDDTAPGFEARVRAAFPEFQPSPAWWADFVATIRQNVEAEEESEPESVKPEGKT